MRWPIVLVLALVAVVGLGGCKKKKAEPAGPSVSPTATVPAPGAPEWAKSPLLATVPADTPYVFASVEPLPQAYTDAQLAQGTATLDQQIAAMRALPDAGKLGPFLAAFFTELKPYAVPGGAAKLGMGNGSALVIYGLGVAPVGRLELGDVAPLKGILERSLAKSGVEPRVGRLGDREYRTIDLGEAGRFTFAFLDKEKQLVAGIYTAAAEAQVLPYLLGVKTPARSIQASGALVELARTYGFRGYGVGYLDVPALTEHFLGLGKGEGGAITNALGLPVRAVAAPCKTELPALARAVPRVVIGYGEVGPTHLTGDVIFELTPAAAAGLAGVTAKVPTLGVLPPPGERPIFAVGAGADVPKLLALLRSWAEPVAARPFACPELAEVNDLARSVSQGLATPLPPQLTDVVGLNIAVTDAEVTPGFASASVQGYVVVRHKNPAQLLGLAKMAPGFEKLDVPTDGRPVKLPLPPEVGRFVPAAQIAAKGDVIVAAAGAGPIGRIPALLAAPGADEAPVFAFAFDSDRFYGTLAKAGLPNTAPNQGQGFIIMNGLADPRGLRLRATVEVPVKK